MLLLMVFAIGTCRLARHSEELSHSDCSSPRPIFPAPRLVQNGAPKGASWNSLHGTWGGPKRPLKWPSRSPSASETWQLILVIVIFIYIYIYICIYIYIVNYNHHLYIVYRHVNWKNGRIMSKWQWGSSLHVAGDEFSFQKGHGKSWLAWRRTQFFLDSVVWSFESVASDFYWAHFIHFHSTSADLPTFGGRGHMAYMHIRSPVHEHEMPLKKLMS